MQFHPAADLFPLIEGDDFAALVADIRANGLREEISLLDGAILDGRNRWRACQESGVKPRFKTMSDDTDPVRFVLSLNLHRRHLSTSQRATVGAKIANMHVGNPQLGINAQLGPTPISRQEVAKMLNVSVRTVAEAKKVLRDAVPEVVAMLEADEVTVKTAMHISDLPREEQREAAKEGPETVKAAARKAKASGNGNDREPAPEGEFQGVGVIRGNEAINCLIRIPKNDRLRKRGFQIVTDWIRRNK